ncbi:MAG: potassium channel family protein [Opitutales bacterium]
MQSNSFYRFQSVEGRGYPAIEWMQTGKFKGGTFPELLEKAVKSGEPLTLEKDYFPMPIVDLKDKGSKWPDVIGTSHLDKHPFIFSQRVIEAMHDSRRIHGVLEKVGPLMLVMTIAPWYLGLTAAAYCLFAAEILEVANSKTGASPNLVELAYFTQITLSTVGYGDYAPRSFPATLVAPVGAVLASALITISLPFVLSVVSAALDRRHLAQEIFGLGETIEELATGSGFASERTSLKTHFISLSSAIDRHAHNHLAYPILFYFHSRQLEQSRAPARRCLFRDELPAGKRAPANGLDEDHAQQFGELRLPQFFRSSCR